MRYVKAHKETGLKNLLRLFIIFLCGRRDGGVEGRTVAGRRKVRTVEVHSHTELKDAGDCEEYMGEMGRETSGALVGQLEVPIMSWSGAADCLALIIK